MPIVYASPLIVDLGSVGKTTRASSVGQSLDGPNCLARANSSGPDVTTADIGLESAAESGD